MTTRKDIRDRVAEVCAISFPALTAVTGRTAKIVDDHLPVVGIYFTAGQVTVENMSGSIHVDGDLTVDFIVSGDDDELDDIADQCAWAIRIDTELRAMSLSVMLVSFEYVRDPESTTSTLRTIFNVVYVADEPASLVNEAGDQLTDDAGNDLVVWGD